VCLLYVDILWILWIHTHPSITGHNTTLSFPTIITFLSCVLSAIGLKQVITTILIHPCMLSRPGTASEELGDHSKCTYLSAWEPSIPRLCGWIYKRA